MRQNQKTFLALAMGDWFMLLAGWKAFRREVHRIFEYVERKTALALAELDSPVAVTMPGGLVLVEH